MLELTGFMGGLYRITEWVYRLALINVLWITGTILGIGIFGFFPATIALFAIVRKWAQQELDVPVWHTFWKTYRKEFLKGNLLGMVITAISLVLYIDFHFIQTSGNETIQLFIVPLLIITLIFMGMLGYIFPTYVHYDMKILEVIRSSFFLLFLHPLASFVMVVGSFGLLYLLQFAPPLAIICSGNLIALTVTKPAHLAFQKAANKYQQKTVEC